MADSAVDVPGRFDVVINSHGYRFADSVEPSLPFRTHRAIYDITPTFIERQNVGAAYSDNQQDFFLTESQKDWSLGEEQKFFRINDADSVRKSWRLDKTQIIDEGQVSLQSASGTITIGGTQYIAASNTAAGFEFLATATTLYKIGYASVSASNAHGLGTTPSGIAHDGTTAFLSATSAGTAGVRKGDGTGALSTFSATASDYLAFHNNSLYGFVNSTATLQRYDTGGTASTIFQWKRPDGTAAPLGSSAPVEMCPYGGQLAIAFNNQLWMYDGVGVTLVAEFPRNFIARGVGSTAGAIAAVDGILLIGGVEYTGDSNNTRPVVYAYTGGSVEKLWRAPAKANNTKISVTGFGGGAVWTDETTSRILYWDPATGAVSGLCAFSGSASILVGNQSQLLCAGGANSGLDALYFPTTATVTSGIVYTSLFDFDNSLTKVFRGVKVDFSSATDGDGGSVDIAYQVDSLDGSYTTLQAGATSGTEYPLTSVTGHSIGLKITLNKGTSTNGPILKRIYLRAAPQLQQFVSGTYILECTGSADEPMELRDGSYHPLTGYEQVQNLLTAAKSTTPFSITDKVNGTFTGVIDLQDNEGWDVYEIHPNTDDPAHPGSYFVRVKVRQV